ncbi:hypothetical protein BKA58DRAFT_379009, partial [Alternaria rosae]|uniref:uncharacterized protein n=1 Tax=Alternaria rosae TaxID=1187941 RepID=UPI001E8CF5AE
MKMSLNLVRGMSCCLTLSRVICVILHEGFRGTWSVWILIDIIFVDPDRLCYKQDPEGTQFCQGQYRPIPDLER